MEAAPKKEKADTREEETRGENNNDSISLCTIPRCYLVSSEIEELDIELWNCAHILTSGGRDFCSHSTEMCVALFQLQLLGGSVSLSV